MKIERRCARYLSDTKKLFKGYKVEMRSIEVAGAVPMEIKIFWFCVDGVSYACVQPLLTVGF